MTDKRGGWKEIDATEDNPLVALPDADRWYVATCQTGGERAAVGALQRYNHIAWFPQLTLWHKFERDKRRVKMNRPVFPGYLFVSPFPFARVGVTECGQWVKWLAGDLDKSRIASVKVRDLDAAQFAGTFINWKNAPPADLAQGDRVTPKDGPFAGFAGIVEMSREGRTRALLEIFGRPTPIEIDTADLRKIA